jgi:hypothetical protein
MGSGVLLTPNTDGLLIIAATFSEVMAYQNCTDANVQLAFDQ